MNADEIARILDELGKRLGPTGEYVFGLAVRQVIIDGVLWSTAAIGSVVVVIIAMRWVMRQYRACECRNSSYSTCGWEPIGMCAGLASTAVVVVATISLITSLSRLLNPEYAALMDILNAISH